MDCLFASRLPVLGRVRMGPLLLPSGHLTGDLTVMRLADDKFMITGSGYLQEFHMMWFEQQSAVTTCRTPSPNMCSPYLVVPRVWCSRPVQSNPRETPP